MFRRVLPVVAALAVLAGTVATADAAHVTYRKVLRQCVNCCDPCAQPIPVVLCVPDPCCDRVVTVNVCVPPCCHGEPTVCCRRGLAGRPVMVYCWPNGYEVHVVFRLRGDVLVLH